MGEPLKQDMKSDRPQPANPTYGVQAEALAGDRSEVAQNLQADVTFLERAYHVSVKNLTNLTARLRALPEGASDGR
jgi:hypothetical protein